MERALNGQPRFVGGQNRVPGVDIPHQNFSGLRLLHLRQRPHLGQHLGRQLAVDLDQRDGVAARRLAAEVEGGDVDAGVAQQRAENLPMKPGLSRLVM